MFAECLMNLFFILIMRRLPNLHLTAFASIAGILLIGFASKSHSLNVGWNSASFLGGPLRIAFAFPVGMLISRLAIPAWMPQIHFAALALAFVALFCIPNLAHGDFVIEVSLALVAMPIVCAIGTATQVKDVQAKLCRFLGLLSYPVYLIHLPILHAILAGSILPTNWQRMAAGILALGVGVAVTWLYDVPVRAWIALTVRRRTAASVHVR